MILRTNQTEITTYLTSLDESREAARILTSPEFPWYYIPNATDLTPGGEGAFVHVLKMDYEPRSSHYDLFHMPLVNLARTAGYKPHEIYRARLGLLFPTKKKHNTPHVDFKDKHHTMLWYINESTGPTLFFNDRLEEIERVEPSQGRVVSFPGHIIHASSPPKEGIRVVMNINLKHHIS